MNAIAAARDRIGTFLDLDRGARFDQFRHQDFEE
jgi:hypothetical protein